MNVLEILKANRNEVEYNYNEMVKENNLCRRNGNIDKKMYFNVVLNYFNSLPETTLIRITNQKSILSHIEKACKKANDNAFKSYRREIRDMYAAPFKKVGMY